jgi:uncharacterized membrane protein
MAPLIVLLLSFVSYLLYLKVRKGELNYALAGKVAMSVMLLFTAIGHFVYTEGMSRMIPSFIPLKKEIVCFTGIVEILAAIGLLIPKFQRLTAWFLILFFILILPANINAAIHSIDYQKGTEGGHGINYLWFRIPLQLLFIGWVYFLAAVDRKNHIRYK